MSDAHIAHDHENETAAWEGGAEPFKASYGKLMMWYFLVSDAFTFAGFLIAYGAIRFSSPTWPEADFVFKSIPFTHADKYPLFFVTFMTFVLIFSSVTMVRAVQEGHRENKRGVVLWMFLTVLGGAIFLGCQAYEWTTLIARENMSVSVNPFSRYTQDGVATYDDGRTEQVYAGQSYLLHKHGDEFDVPTVTYANGETSKATFGPKAFGALFFFITGFHGFHVFSGVLFLAIIMINAASGIYAARKNGYEMVEKIGLYWHFVDLVWVFVFLVFYLI